MSGVLYPGSFDPVTNGHVDVIQRLKKIFPKVVVLVADSPNKNYWFSNAERVSLLKDLFKKDKTIEIASGDDLTVNFAIKNKINVIARSARTIADWEFEYAMADANKKLAPNIETIFIMANPNYSYISSSLVREVALYGGDTSAFVPNLVTQALKKIASTKMLQKRGQK